MEKISDLKTDNVFIHIFKIPIYDSKVCFIKYKNATGFNEALCFCETIGLDTTEYKDDKEDSYKNCYGFTFKERVKMGFVHFIFMNNSEEYKDDYINTLSHENYHLIDSICRHHGLKHTGGDNEHIAYLTGYLFDILHKF